MGTRTIEGTYGSSQTPCNIFVYRRWYVVEGSTGVNRACSEDELIDGVDVEEISDVDFFTWSREITTEEELEEAVDA
jgi:hypothetical protein